MYLSFKHSAEVDVHASNLLVRLWFWLSGLAGRIACEQAL